MVYRVSAPSGGHTVVFAIAAPPDGRMAVLDAKALRPSQRRVAVRQRLAVRPPAAPGLKGGEIAACKGFGAMLDARDEAERTVFVGNLCSSVNEEILFELFLQAGPLKKVTIARDKEGRQRSYGFVCYKHREAVPYAIALLDGMWLYGRPIRLKYRYESFQNHEAGPDHSDPWWQDQRGLARFPESSVLHFTALPDCSPLQDLLFWNMVCGRSSKQHSPGIPALPYQPAPSGLSSPMLPWPGFECPQWALDPSGRNRPSLIVTHEPAGHESQRDKAECRTRHRHKKARESRCRHRQRVVQKKSSADGDEVP